MLVRSDEPMLKEVASAVCVLKGIQILNLNN